VVKNVIIVVVGLYFEGNLNLRGINLWNQVSFCTCTE
jgi:hypothetical protein